FQEVLFPAWRQLPVYAWAFEKASLTRQNEKNDGEEGRFLSLRATGPDWFGPHFLSPAVDLPSSGRSRISVEAVRRPGLSKLQLSQSENPVAEPVDLCAEKAAKSSRVLLGQLRQAEGKSNLMIKLVGKNERSAGLGLDLINVICVRAE